MKTMFAVLVSVFCLATISPAMARVWEFNDLIEDSAAAPKVDPNGDKILFKHDLTKDFPLIFKVQDDGIKFQLDHGSKGASRYEKLGIVAVPKCGSGALTPVSLKHVRGTIVTLECK